MGLPVEKLDTPLLHNEKDLYAELKKRKKLLMKNRMIIWTILVVMITWGWIGTGFNIFSLFQGISNIASFILFDMFPPDFSAVSGYIQPALQTIYMSFVGMVFFRYFVDLFWGIGSKKYDVSSNSSVS
ncbi:hypothetical protein [Bacillus sp. JCM 19034]|uniref:hypothetical protein n=1 Tax=Bacillus sp. JCM 19034 TaxID=1481928 RepID=UPI000782C3DB|nr:hypothetical protein [Bacillus sp. JCM 19034]